MQCPNYLTQNDLSAHMKRQTAEVKQHLVGHQVLLYDILAIDGNDSCTDKQVEIVGLVSRPAGFPQTEGIRLDKFALET